LFRVVSVKKERRSNVTKMPTHARGERLHPDCQACPNREPANRKAATKERNMLETLIGLVILVIDIWAIISVLTGYDTFARKLLWTLLILLLPVIGVILYLLLGRSPADARV
jgi:hypothetical protein